MKAVLVCFCFVLVACGGGGAVGTSDAGGGGGGNVSVSSNPLDPPTSATLSSLQTWHGLYQEMQRRIPLAPEDTPATYKADRSEYIYFLLSCDRGTECMRVGWEKLGPGGFFVRFCMWVEDGVFQKADANCNNPSPAELIEQDGGIVLPVIGHTLWVQENGEISVRWN